eukprot:s863_g14.t2
MTAFAWMVQLVFSQESSRQLFGSQLCGSCQLKCAENGKVCDPAQQRALQGAALVAQVAALGWTCNNAPLDANDVVASDLAPYIVGTTISGTTGSCKSSGAASDSNCGRRGGSSVRVCCCVPQGGIVDDPHVRTLRNEFYTLLKSGNFLAWSFSKAPVDWRLYAAYSGAKFTTQSLLLVESQSGQTLEFTADTCAWQMRTENGWSPVQPQEVEEVNTVTDEPLNLESVINLKMPSQNGARNVARLLTHCSPQNHVNFLVKMFDSNDLDYAGGELGSIQDATKGHVSFLSTKLTSMAMKTDDELPDRIHQLMVRKTDWGGGVQFSSMKTVKPRWLKGILMTNVILGLCAAAACWRQVASLRETEADRAQGALSEFEPFDDEEIGSNAVPVDLDEDAELEDATEKRIDDDMNAITARETTESSTTTTTTTKAKQPEMETDLFGDHGHDDHRDHSMSPDDDDMFGLGGEWHDSYMPGTDKVTSDAIRHLDGEDDEVVETGSPKDGLYKDAAEKAKIAQEKAKKAQEDALGEANASAQLTATEKELEAREKDALEQIRPLKELEETRVQHLKSAQDKEKEAIALAIRAQEDEKEALRKLETGIQPADEGPTM